MIIVRDNKVKNNAYNECFAFLMFNDNDSLLNFIRIAIKNEYDLYVLNIHNHNHYKMIIRWRNMTIFIAIASYHLLFKLIIIILIYFHNFNIHI